MRTKQIPADHNRTTHAGPREIDDAFYEDLCAADSGSPDPAPITVTFAELSATLASVHRIASSKRTAFDARLKNMNRLKLEKAQGRGITARYNLEMVMRYATALELTQCGLSPDLIVQMMPKIWPTIWLGLASGVRLAMIEVSALGNLTSANEATASVKIGQCTIVYGSVFKSRCIFLDLFECRQSVLLALSSEARISIDSAEAELARLSGDAS